MSRGDRVVLLPLSILCRAKDNDLSHTKRKSSSMGLRIPQGCQSDAELLIIHNCALINKIVNRELSRICNTLPNPLNPALVV
jgi:hypothetical protein